MKLSSQSELQFAHLNVNMGIKGVREDVKKSVYGTLAFFTENKPEEIYKSGDLKEIVNPILNMGGDVLGFSEVYGKRNLTLLTELLEKKGYNVYNVDAFQMWSQAIPGEHLYNVVGIKSDIDNNKKEPIKTKVLNNRQIEGTLISLKHLLSGKSNLENSIINEAINLYKRLTNGILDGAITTFELTPEFAFSHLHVHADNENLHNYFTKHTFENKAHLMFGDFNIKNLDEFILTPPFSGKGYKTLLPIEEKTYSYARGLVNLPLHQKPDNVIGNSFIENIQTNSIPSLSDHNTIKSKIKIK